MEKKSRIGKGKAWNAEKTQIVRKQQKERAWNLIKAKETSSRGIIPEKEAISFWIDEESY